MLRHALSCNGAGCSPSTDQTSRDCRNSSGLGGRTPIAVTVLGAVSSRSFNAAQFKDVTLPFRARPELRRAWVLFGRALVSTQD